MERETHKITAPIGVEAVEAVESEFDLGKRGLRIVAWAEEAWPDYVAVEDRITGRVRVYGSSKGAIVRCRECAIAMEGTTFDGDRALVCRRFQTFNHETDPDGFCAWGERMAGHGEG